ncbi:MAG TPA: hypothetical protein PKA41_13740 [Verrucomicrobiota bacterium]|nr:hypothetical protein [Verrucomicrobiota bacterium]
MLGLTQLGILHTAISLVALGAGLFALVRDKQITGRNGIGKLYVWTTVLTCLTGFPILQHGGFGKPHALGIITLVTLVIAALAARNKFGRPSRYIEVVSYTATILFHLIPGFVETTTRLPLNNPLIKDREGPELQAITGVLFLLFLIVATLQVLRLRKAGCSPHADGRLTEGVFPSIETK